MNIDQLIDKVAGEVTHKRTCLVCECDDLARAITRFMERKETGELLPPFATMHRKLFSKMLNVSVETTKTHIERCLGIDYRTGKTL